MGSFQYEWWDIDIRYVHGMCTTEFKGKNKENIIRQIKKEMENDDTIVEVFWETLHLDRKGYQRLY